MKNFLISFLMISLIISGLFAKASELLVDKYMDLSGAQTTIESMGSQLINNIKQRDVMYGKKTDPKNIELFEEVFDSDKGVQKFKKYLSNEFDNDTLKQIIAYYKTPIAKKIVQANIDSLDPDAQAKLLRFMANLSNNPPSNQRVEIIKKVIQKLKLSQNAIDIFKLTMDFFNKQNPNNSLAQDKINQILPLVKQGLEQRLFITYLYVYKDIENKELESMLLFYDTESGQKEIQVVQNGLKQIIQDGFNRAFKK